MTDLRDWVHCPRCASDLVVGVVEEAERLHCTACNLVIYDNPAPTACAVMFQDGCVMLTLRGIEPAIGKWDLPGGYIEVGEDPQDALHREMAEETGLSIEITELQGIYLDTYGDGGTDTLNICYRARATDGDPVPASDVVEIRWFEIEAIPWGDLAFRNTREALEALVAGLPGNDQQIAPVSPHQSEV